MKKSTRLILTGAAAYTAAIAPRLIHRPDPMPEVYYAHRGLYDNAGEAPENTLPAFRLAAEAGYGIELDVQLTLDDQVVVAHDSSLKRICGTDKEIDTLTYRQLQQYTIMHSQETVPLFAEVLKLINGRVPLIVEIKMKDARSSICEKTDAILRDYHGEYSVESFNPAALLWYRIYRPRICRGQLSENFQRHEGTHSPVQYIIRYLLTNFLTKPDFIAYDWRDRRSISLNICRHIFKCPAVAWTIQSQQQLEECRGGFDRYIFENFRPEKGEYHYGTE